MLGAAHSRAADGPPSTPTSSTSGAPSSRDGSRRPVAARPWVGVGYDYATGDENPDDDRRGTFDQLFPLAHSYFGVIDAVARQNVRAVSATTGFWPIRERVSPAAEDNWLHLADPEDALYGVAGRATRPGGVSETDIGFELDLTASWRVGPRTAVTVGFSRLVAGTFLERTGSAETVTFFYTQVRYDLTEH